MEEQPKELLEIYKLHVELADRVSARRGEAARAHITLLSGLAALLGIVARTGGGDVPLWVVSGGISFVAMVVAVSWALLIESYRQLNRAKFEVLCKLEDKLAFQFFSMEWVALGEGREEKKYLRLTEAESILPYAVALACVGLLAGSVIWRWQ